MADPATAPVPGDRPVAIVTGGTRGIGRAVVEHLVAAGFMVEFTYLTSRELAAEVVDSAGGHARASRVDGRDPCQVKCFVAEVAERGSLQALVNNQGTTTDLLAGQVTWEALEQLLAANVGSAVSFTHEALPHLMRNRRGDVVFISSLARSNARVGNTMYGVSKAALTRYAASLALEGARFNIFVNVIEPGFVETELTRDLLEGKARQEYLKEIPLHRLTQPDDVAAAVAALLSRSPSLVGAVLPVAGGAQL